LEVYPASRENFLIRSASYFILDASTGGFGGFGQIKP